MERYKVIDDYFPQWMIDSVSNYLKTYPVTYDNTPNDTFDKARFLGNTLLMQDRWNVMGYERYWFIDYFNMCIQHDILKELNINDKSVLKGIKEVAEGDEKAETRLKALFKLADILDLEDKTQTKVTQLSGAVFQGFSDNILGEIQRPKELKE